MSNASGWRPKFERPSLPNDKSSRFNMTEAAKRRLRKMRAATGMAGLAQQEEIRCVFTWATGTSSHCEAVATANVDTARDTFLAECMM